MASITSHECQVKLERPYCNSKYCFYILLCFYHFYQDSTFMENVEETLKIEEYSSPWNCIDLWSSNSWKENNSDRKIFFKFLYSPLEKFTKRRTYFLDPFYQHYSVVQCSAVFEQIGLK